MSYATVPDLLARLGEPRLTQLTDLADPSVGLYNPQVAQKALDDASDEIDGYLLGRYLLPMTAGLGVLRVHALTIAHYRLLGSAVDDATKDDYKNVLGYLAKVAAGTVSLMAAADAPAPLGVGTVLFDSGPKVMGRQAF